MHFLHKRSFISKPNWRVQFYVKIFTERNTWHEWFNASLRNNEALLQIIRFHRSRSTPPVILICPYFWTFSNNYTHLKNLFQISKVWKLRASGKHFCHRPCRWSSHLMVIRFLPWTQTLRSLAEHIEFFNYVPIFFILTMKYVGNIPLYGIFQCQILFSLRRCESIRHIQWLHWFRLWIYTEWSSCNCINGLLENYEWDKCEN